MKSRKPKQAAMASLSRELCRPRASARASSATFRAARSFYARALENFQMFRVATEIPRVRWAYALALADDARPHESISELFIVRAEYLRFGMITDAALAALDVVRIKSALGEDIAYAAAELVETFAKAGMAQNALE